MIKRELFTRDLSRNEKASYHHGDLEVALIEESKKLVSLLGVEHVSLRQVALNVGVSPSAAYHHFPDKEALLKSAARSTFEDLAEFQERAIADFLGVSPVAARRRFRALGMAYVVFAKENPNLFRLCFGPYCGGDEMTRQESRPWRLLVSGLNELERHGDVHPKVRPYAEILVWSAIHGVANLILDQLLSDDAVDKVIDSLVIALKSSAKVEN
jgi:AcrR family transcriptional regulator